MKATTWKKQRPRFHSSQPNDFERLIHELGAKFRPMGRFRVNLRVYYNLELAAVQPLSAND